MIDVNGQYHVQAYGVTYDGDKAHIFSSDVWSRRGAADADFDRLVAYYGIE